MPSLEKYNKKRDFKATSEPEGKEAVGKSKFRFVVQRHDASRLHYDLRLEIGGVLKSWAVPKGPSLNPKDKRLAVMTEDHPLKYLTFKGEIPKGNYGYGTMSIFDSGTFKPLDKRADDAQLQEDLENGSLKFVLNGKVLKGEFALVKMKSSDDNAWLLIKHKDKFAVSEGYDSEDFVDKEIKDWGKQFKVANKGRKVSKKTASKLETSTPDEQETSAKKDNIHSPMLATLSERIPDDGEWIFEQKLDGYRAIASIAKKKVSLKSRNELSFAKQFPSILKALESIPHEVILDGEIVAFDKNKQSNFQILKSGEPLPAKYQIYYVVFDILALDGNDLRDFTLVERKELLELLLRNNPHPQIQLLESLDMTIEKALAKAKKQKWEGIIAKEASSRYISGKRSSLWRKIKFQQAQEAIVVGYTKPQAGRKYLGALVLAVYERKELVYIGNCGTGFTDAILKEVYEILKPLEISKKPFNKSIVVANERKVIWTKPKLVAEIEFAEWTADHHMRHPVFKAIREDKNPEEIHRVIPVRDVVNERELVFGKRKVKLTNQKKVYWPDDHLLKSDLLNYYEAMAELILPYLKDKPISMNRFPNGIDEPSFFQKDLDTKNSPSWIKTASLTSENTGKTIDYLICNDEATLLWMANLGSIEINPWLSSYKKKQFPDFAVLDLDPNGVEMEKVVQVALFAHEILESIQVPNYVKTSGSEGLHIYIYLGAQYDYDVSRTFVQMLAELINEQFEDITSVERSPSKRKGKIYLDYMQNKKGQTIVAPYSVRPKPGATVSTPLNWDEVNTDLTIAQFTMQTVVERVGKIADPWQTIFDVKVNLKKALEKI
ncbi:DNA ligase D [Sphingobacterium hungaricum]|uniref:DNA ligase (ATP) n=1 Tax=Sphingobacterium hungaricum TaxID=2082723 RepID=A0A928V2R6_9SPHI|nr:DNA ligase D [Sphingobacterium hungaricum]MBE8715069.1 DNA ligase D [Sphingobacterium hungaricum]